MAKRVEAPPEGTPDWMLTYGDMVTLLLCFFVLLFTMSEIKQDKLTKTMRAFQMQLGVLPKHKATVQIFVQSPRMTQTEANVLRRGPPGRHPSVQTIVEDERVKVIIGGQKLFEPGSAQLKPTGRLFLRQEVAPGMRGYPNRIEIRGHTATTRLEHQDVWFLAYERAYAVMRFLADEGKINERRFRVISCADHEPRDSNLTEEGRKNNRRVEIIMTEEFIRNTGEAGAER